jgi:hypothetical protein
MQQSSRNVEGGCLCGAVRYRATGPGTNATLCHCVSCRRAAGAPLVAWVTFASANFAFTAAQPNAYHSSPPVVRTFCGRCGSPLTYVHADFPGEIDVTIASLDQPDDVAPRDHTWTSQQLRWMQGIAELRSFTGRRESQG